MTDGAMPVSSIKPSIKLVILLSLQVGAGFLPSAHILNRMQRSISLQSLCSCNFLTQLVDQFAFGLPATKAEARTGTRIMPQTFALSCMDTTLMSNIGDVICKLFNVIIFQILQSLFSSNYDPGRLANDLHAPHTLWHVDRNTPTSQPPMCS